MFQNFLYNGITSKGWQSYHLFTNQNLDDVIMQVLVPLVENFYYKNKCIEQFFFIRYWEEGPHLRIRFRVVDTMLEQDIVDQVVFFIEKLIKINAANSNVSSYLKKQEYVPEFGRYGGQLGILLAEQIFQLSSLTVLELMKGKDLKPFSTKIATAMQLHWVLNKTLLRYYKGPIEEIYFYIFKNWLPKNTSTSLVSPLSSIEDSFEKSYQQQKEEIEEMLKAVGLEKNLTLEIRNWQDGLNKLAFSFEKLIEEIAKYIKREDLDKYIRHMIDSYIHMTNNRLGIDNIHESFIGFLLFNVLKTEDNLNCN